MGHSDFNCWLDGVPVCVRAHVVIKGVSGSVVVAVVDIIAGTAAVPFNCFFFSGCVHSFCLRNCEMHVFVLCEQFTNGVENYCFLIDLWD